MIKSFLLVAAAAACAFSGAHGTACGWIGDSCCNLKPYDHNIGTCFEARSACWEGLCMPCGKDGKPICAGPQPCNAGLFNKNGFCVPAPNPRPVFKPPPVFNPPPVPPPCGREAQLCCFSKFGGVCTDPTTVCSGSICIKCGATGRPACRTGPPCSSPGDIVDGSGNCVTPAPPSKKGGFKFGGRFGKGDDDDDDEDDDDDDDDDNGRKFFKIKFGKRKFGKDD